MKPGIEDVDNFQLINIVENEVECSEENTKVVAGLSMDKDLSRF